MERSQLTELGYITGINNLPSIAKLGILSHDRAERLKHDRIDMAAVQENREATLVPPSHRRLHSYANLYICPRNPMLSVRRGIHDRICVLRVQPAILDMAGVVVTDQNAGGHYRRFAAAPEGLSIVDYERTFAEYWTHPEDQIDEWRHKSQKCAEVLVPDVIPASLIFGAYVSCTAADDAVQAAWLGLETKVDAALFFR
jgi:hypothetical protein